MRILSEPTPYSTTGSALDLSNQPDGPVPVATKCIKKNSPLVGNVARKDGKKSEI
jgi:hypothetical protein